MTRSAALAAAMAIAMSQPMFRRKFEREPTDYLPPRHASHDAEQIAAIRKIVWNLRDAPQQGENMNHKLDTDQQVFFYEQDFYVLSNFSSFRVKWQGIDFDTSEHAYHWEKFRDHPDAWSAAGSIAEQVRRAPSAHAAFKLAERCKPRRRPDWDDVKVEIMRGILKAKVNQHEYVRRKLLETGTRELVEDSWRDDFWGWGPNKNGKNMLGRLWMEIREELRAANQCGIAA